MHWTIQKLLEWEQIISLCKLFLLVFLSSDFFYVLFVICENHNLQGKSDFDWLCHKLAHFLCSGSFWKAQCISGKAEVKILKNIKIVSRLTLYKMAFSGGKSSHICVAIMIHKNMKAFGFK